MWAEWLTNDFANMVQKALVICHFLHKLGKIAKASDFLFCSLTAYRFMLMCCNYLPEHAFTLLTQNAHGSRVPHLIVKFFGEWIGNFFEIKSLDVFWVLELQVYLWVKFEILLNLRILNVAILGKWYALNVVWVTILR